MGAGALVAVLVAVALTLAGVLDGPGGAPAPAPAEATAPCAFWYATGDRPTEPEIEQAATQDRVVILNPWETDALHRLKQLNPAITVLVYKDLSSTRSYDDQGLGQDGRSAGGLDYAATDQQHPDWFAQDTDGRRIEWDPYPGHWQMAVWNPAYQQAWVDAVTQQAVTDGWDGVFADNDFASLRYYAPAVVAGTSGQDATDQLVRDGLDQMVTAAGQRLRAAGKILVPNVSEARLYPGRWDSHSRFGGAMEENFAYFQSGDQYVDNTVGWRQQTAQTDDPDRISLAVTRTEPGDDRAQRYGFASAAVRGEGEACWTMTTTPDYSKPERSPYQDIPLGAPLGPGEDRGDGVWTRAFRNGWIAVNPTDAAVTVEPPSGMRTPDGRAAARSMSLPATDAVVLQR